jgi:MscS family membrane protein
VRSGRRKWFFVTIVAVLICAQSWGQIPAVSAIGTHTQSPSPEDPHGRNTPQSTMLEFVRYAQLGDYETAAKYLEPPTPKRNYDPEETARRLLVLINTSFRGSIAALSNKPEGSAIDSNDPNIDIAGNFVAGDQLTPLLLQRITRKDAGSIWVISYQTIERVPDLYQRVGSPRLARYFPAFLVRNTMAGVPLGQWLSWLISLPLSLLAGWGLVRLGNWLWRLCTRKRATLQQASRLRRPLIFIVAILVNARAVVEVGIPLFFRVYYFRFLGVLFAICIAWLCIRIADVAFARMHQRRIRRESRSLLQLVHRLNNAIISVIALLCIITILGFDTKTMLAGLGIGGIALALAAQKTLENLIGGITLVMDETASVGDDCIIFGRVVTIKEIGLRSIRVVTREGTEITYPNGVLSQTNIEDLSRRSKFLISTSLFLSHACSLAQLQLVIAKVREILYSHPRIELETARFRTSGLTAAGVQVDLFAYVLTTDGNEFNGIQEDILFRIIKVMEEAGVAWAPSQMIQSKNDSIDQGKLNEAERAVQGWQKLNAVPFPDFAPAQIAEMRGTLAYPPEGSAVRQDSDPPRRSPDGAH